MAIIVEQEKKPVNWIAALSTIIIVVVLFLGGYFIFFKKPELIEIVTPGALDNLSEISKISDFDPNEVFGNPTFKVLRQFGVSIPTPIPGRLNPFKPF